ncbi:MAG: carboxypeptidase-like regulatory domain-containing protein [Flavobacteriales bacterium]|nr:carboxypeptidase-like regulatory domain-containing protein [Flavobacteriales bacterium]
MRFLLTAVLIALAARALGQAEARGRVVDARTLEPLAFVHVVAGSATQGASSDIDGRFAVLVSGFPTTLRFSYVGYATIEVQAAATEMGLVRMERTAIALREAVVVAGENPAHRIIKRVHANRRVNDSMRHRAYRYASYSKTILTADVDSALLNDPVRMAALDSSDREAIDFLDRQHLMLIESATRKTFRPPASEKEEVIAMRVSGLKDPSIIAMVASTKTFSLYDPQVRISDRTYLSPIGPASTERYLFILQDTLYQQDDSVFVISFQPRQGKKFDALKGVLWVSSDGYALANVIAEPVARSGGMGIKLQQRFERVQGAWFPVQLNTFLYLDNVKVNDMSAVGIGRTYLKDIEVDPPIERKELRGAELVMDRVAAKRDEAFWQGVRDDTLSGKELRTYHTIDSISEAEGLEKKLQWAERLVTGRVPMGPVDLRLNEVLRYNAYEGIRVGAGLATNDRISRYFSLGGYGAYGFVDQAWKYGGDLVLKPNPGIGPELKLYYDVDVAESGGVSFPGARAALLDPDGYRWFYVSRMDQQERIGAELAWRMGSQLRFWLATERNDRRNLQGYTFAEPAAEGVTLLSDRFVTGTVSLGARFAFREQLVRTPGRLMTIPSKWPVLQVKATRAEQGLWEGERAFLRLDAMVEKSFRLRMLGTLSVRAMGGIVDADVPYAFLYNLRGSNDPSLRVAARNTFEAMRPNEFAADRYAALHVRHSFGHLLFTSKRWKPEPVVVATAAWGAMDEPERHRGLGFTPLREGYYEAGLQVDNVLNLGLTGFGIGAFSRFGPYAAPEALDNVVVKATVGLRF